MQGEGGKLLLITHMRDACLKGHSAVWRYDPQHPEGGVRLICLSCAGQLLQFVCSRCVECGAEAVTLYTAPAGVVRWRARCSSGHTRLATVL